MAGEHTTSGVAGRYANALFELAREENALDSVETGINRFGEALDASEDLSHLVRSPLFSADDQTRALAAILTELKIEGLTANFLKLVAQNHRLFAAPGMIRAFRTLLAQHRNQLGAEVTSATKLEEGQMRALKATLASALGKDVQIEARVDPSLLGGLVIKVGSRMIDSSLKAKLNTLKHAMKEAQ